jgi:hypothetical protein
MPITPGDVADMPAMTADVADMPATAATAASAGDGSRPGTQSNKTMEITR